MLPSRNSLNYRYAFQGQELDTETGMEAFQLRLWDGRIGRWLSTDPYRQYASPYLGMGNNPISSIDPDGGFDIEPSTPGIRHSAQPEGDYYWNDVNSSYEFEARPTNPFTPFDDANNYLTMSLNTAGKLAPLDNYMKALKANKFIFNYNGVDKVWKMGYNGGGNAKIANSLIQSAKAESQFLGTLGYGLKHGGTGLAFLGAVSTERQYQLGYINEDRRNFDHAINVINTRFPIFALGTIPGNYIGQKYHPQIEYQVENPNAFVHKATVFMLRLGGVPASRGDK